MSFARAFTAAGSKSVVASLWSVNDESTAEIMAHFYQYLKSGDTKDEALRKAKLQYIREADPTFQHPYFWAGFIGIGDMTPLSGRGAMQNNLLFVLGVVLLLLVLYFTAKKPITGS